MWPLGLDVSEEAFDPGLIGGRMGAAVVLGDGHQRHVSASVVRGHRRPVVGHGQF